MPFAELLKKFWPDCPYPVEWWTDEGTPGASWCEVLLKHSQNSDDRVLLMLEDFLLTEPVHQELIAEALLLAHHENADLVRLFPMPGADGESINDRFGVITKQAEYRISAQTAIWKENYLRQIASQFNDAWEFETEGTKFSRTIPGHLLSFRRGSGPWPISHLCSGISRGKWNPDALKLFEQHGIDVDLSLREVA